MKPTLAVILSCALWAGADEVVYTGYYFGDNVDNTVATTSFSLVKTLWARTRVLLDVELDQTTVPPLEEDAISGASRPARKSKSEFRKNRGQIIVGVEQGLGDDTRLGANVYFSQEVDYLSQAVTGTLSQDLFKKNLTVTLRAQYTLDSVGEILINDSLVNRGKETHQASLVLSQSLSPTSTLVGGVDAFRIIGFQSDPYRKAVIATAVPLVFDTLIERHPDTRFRQAVWVELTKYVRGIDGAFIVNYRYYWDDWGVNANTATFKFNKYVTKNWIFSPWYRYYDQSEADFGEYASGGQTFDALDYKLQTFGSNTLGAGLTCFLRTFSRNHPTWDFLNNTSVSVEYLRYFNDFGTGFSANVVESSLKFSF
ncbi:MAG: DUF3570 domain-containing protein [Fibrobacterota bacterium]|nr:DUF3570 domain-containing protein [Fibrobacterota bacterium]